MPINEYDELLSDMQAQQAGPKPPAPATVTTEPPNPYGEIIDAERAAREAEIRTRKLGDGSTAPDRAAEILKLSARTGLSPDLVARNYDTIVARARITDTPYSRMLQETPVLADWLTMPMHNAVSEGDHDNLGGLERLLRLGTHLPRAFVAGVFDQFSQGVWGAIAAASEAISPNSDLATFARGSAVVASSLAGKARGDVSGMSQLERDVLSGIESIGGFAPGLVLSALSGGSAIPALGVAGVSTGGTSYVKARDEGLDPWKAMLHGGVQGAIEIATEFLPAHLLLKDLAAKSGLVKILMHQIASEVPGEEVATALQDLNEWAMLPSNKDRSFGDYLRERPSAFVSTLVSVVTSVGATGAIARASQHFVEKLGERAAQSTTIQRAPDAVEQMLTKATEGTPTATLYAPVDTFTEYWQSKSIDPRTIATELTGDDKAYDAAIATGTDLAIPTAKYATRLAATEHNAFFASELRLGPDLMNGREAEEFIQQQAAVPAPIDKTEPTAADKVEQQVRQQLIERAGATPETATDYARLHRAVFGTLASDANLTGVQADTLFARYGLKINRPALGDVASAQKAKPAGEAGAAEANAPAGAETGAKPAEAAPRGAEAAVPAAEGQPPAGPTLEGVSGKHLAVLTDAAGATLPADGQADTEAGQGTGGAAGAQGNAPDRSAVTSGRTDIPGRVGEPGGATEVRARAPRGNEAGAQTRGTDAIPTAYRARFDILVDGARELGYTGTDDSLAQLFLEQVADAKTIARDASTLSDDVSTGRDLLQAIAEAGGLGIEQDSAFAGELETMLESLHGRSRNTAVIKRGKRAGEDQKLPPMPSGGVKGIPKIIVRKGGRPVDTIRESVAEDPRFAHFESNSDFLEAVTAAIGEEVGTREKTGGGSFPVDGVLADVLDVRPEVRWWAEAPAALENNGSGESAASLEAIGRTQAMRARGETFVVYDRTGARRPLIGVDAVDYHPFPGETFGIEGPGGFRVLEDAGGKVPDAEVSNLLADIPAADLQSDEGGDTSFDISEFDQDLFDLFTSDEDTPNVQLSGAVDRLSTGELQPRLPGDVGAVREQEVKDQPIAELRDEFRLTAPAETEETQTSLFQESQSPEYRAAAAAFDAADLEYVAEMRRLGRPPSGKVALGKWHAAAAANLDKMNAARAVFEKAQAAEEKRLKLEREGTQPTQRELFQQALTTRDVEEFRQRNLSPAFIEAYERSEQALRDLEAATTDDERVAAEDALEAADKALERESQREAERVFDEKRDAKRAGRELFQSGKAELTPAIAQQFADQLKARTGPNLVALDLRVNAQGNLVLETIAVRRGATRLGIGTRVMSAITAFADRFGARIELSLAEKGYNPDDAAATTSSEARLEAFYRRFGFVRNRGRYKDYALSIYTSMYRDPSERSSRPSTDAGDVVAPEDTPLKPMAGRSREFREWFGESKVVDAEGQPLVVYHGTQRLDRFGPRILKRRATSGPLPFFTSDPAIASKYATGKQDTSLSLEDSRFENWFRVTVPGMRGTVDIARAWYHLTPGQQATIAKLAPRVRQNEEATEIILDKEGTKDGIGNYDYEIVGARGNHLQALVRSWLESGAIFNEEERFEEVLKAAGFPLDVTFDSPHMERSGVVPVYMSLQNPLRTSELTDDIVNALEKASRRQRPKREQGGDPWDKSQRDPKEWMDQLRQDRKDNTALVWTSIPDWVTKTLRELGYDGIIDTGGKHGGVAHAVYIPFEPRQIKSAIGNQGKFKTSSDNILKQDRRGVVRFGDDRQFSIDLFERADLSTFLHESGHFFLEVYRDVAEQVNAIAADARTATQKDLVANFEALNAWLEHKGGKYTDEQHEQFARGFEAYLMEGQAPSLELRSSFARFRAWLIGIYRSLRSLNVKLTPEVRKVMGRMLATERAIQQAQQNAQHEPLFTTAESAKVDPAEFELYRKSVADASRQAREQLELRLMSEVQREQEAQWKREREVIRSQVQAEVFARPEVRAMAAIRRGMTPDGQPLTEGETPEPMKLSKAIITERYGAERLKTLPRPPIYTTEDGLDPDLVADMFGFDSGDAMLTAIANAGSPTRIIEEETERRMQLEHGSLLIDGTIHERARAAVANESRESVVRAELAMLRKLRRVVRPALEAGAEALRDERRERLYERRWFEAESKLRIAIAEAKGQEEIHALRDQVSALRQQARGGARRIDDALPPANVVQQAAENTIARTKIRDLQPELYWHAARAASGEATAAAARQNFDVAIAAKRRELTSLALYRLATKTRDDVLKRVDKAKKMGSRASLERIGLAGQSYVDQVRGVLSQYEFADVPIKELNRRARIVKWTESLEADGLPADLPNEVLNDALQVNYKDLSVEQFMGVTDGLTQIAHLARLKMKLLKAQDAREFAKVRDALVESIRANGPKEPLPAEQQTEDGKRRTLGDIFASHVKIGTLARVMDGGVDGGAMWEAIIRPLNAASDDEQVRRDASSKALREILTRHYSPKEMAALGTKHPIAGLPEALTKEKILAVALNWGNESSRQRILNQPRRNWTQVQVDAILDTLDRRDWQFVQDVWDYVDTFWADIAAKSERVTGLAPEKVIPLPVATKFGLMRGGYYPLMNETRLSARATGLELASAAQLQQAAAYVGQATKRGHEKARKQGVKEPVKLSFSVLFAHVDNVIHDLTHHEALIDVTRLLRDREVQRAIFETKGDLAYRQFINALSDIAAGGAKPAENSLDRAADWMKGGTQIAGLAWNVWTALQQPLGLFNGMSRVGPKWVLRGLKRWLSDAASMEHTTKWINEVSPFMRSRAVNATQDLAELHADYRRAGGWFDTLVRTVTNDRVTQQTMLDGFMWHISLAQRVADVPTWIGAYEKARAGGNDEKRSVALADQAVIDAQGSGSVKDLAGIQRGRPIARIWMTFYSYGNTLLNSTYDVAARTNFKSAASTATFAGHLTLLYVLPALALVALRHAFQGDDDDDWLKETAGEALSSAMNTVVFLRELQGLVGEGNRGYEGPAGARVFSLATKLGAEIQQGKIDEGLEKALNATGGVLFRYPATQVQRTIDGITALDEGRTDNPFAVVFGAPRAKK